MATKNQKLFVLAAACLAVVGFFYSINSNTVFHGFVDQFSPVNWDEVKERDIVKNTMPIKLLEKTGDSCKVYAEKFDYVIDYPPFVKSKELADKLNYDKNTKTFIVPCEQLKGDESKLHVWFVIPEAERHATKYEYFITESNSTQPRS